jgi:hypothetical protein
MFRNRIPLTILNSRGVAWRPRVTGQPPTASIGKSVWPARQHARIDALVRHGAGLYDLWETSPVRLEPTTMLNTSRLTAASTSGRPEPSTERIIDALFPGDPVLCVARTHGRSAADFATRWRERWRGHLNRCALMVPSPMAALGADPATWSPHQFQSPGGGCAPGWAAQGWPDRWPSNACKSSRGAKGRCATRRSGPTAGLPNTSANKTDKSSGRHDFRFPGGFRPELC